MIQFLWFVQLHWIMQYNNNFVIIIHHSRAEIPHHFSETSPRHERTRPAGGFWEWVPFGTPRRSPGAVVACTPGRISCMAHRRNWAGGRSGV